MVSQNVLSMIEEVGGQDAITICQVLTTKKDITDEQIAEITELKLNKIRKILYKFNESQIATYRRERDPETGWFVYYWTFRQEGMITLVQQRQKAVLNVLQQRYDFESQNAMYTCETRCQQLLFNEAFETSFMCPTCSSLLVQIENDALLNVLQSKISKLTEVLANDTKTT